MNADTATGVPAPSKTRKLIVQFVIGALSGAAVTYAALELLDGQGFDAKDPSRMLALGVGLIFALIGLFVAIGVMMPRAGARLLNVEDADELLEQRKTLRSSALLFILAGAGLIALALGGGPGEPAVLSLAASGWVAAVCFAGVVILAIANRNTGDEMMRSLSREAAQLSVYALSAIAILWAIGTHLGRAPALDSLGVLAAVLGIQLLSVMIAVGRGGLLAPR